MYDPEKYDVASAIVGAFIIVMLMFGFIYVTVSGYIPKTILAMIVVVLCVYLYYIIKNG
jgi:hypothetical protein